jgi:hypothetical protein
LSVHCLQVVDGVPAFEQVVEPPVEGWSDTETLHAKASSASANDWDVEWLTDHSFVARKVRWLAAALCERVFEVR